MYLPENKDQMFEILTELRVYAATHALPKLAEELDDALMLLEIENRRRIPLAKFDQSAGDKT